MAFGNYLVLNIKKIPPYKQKVIDGKLSGREGRVRFKHLEANFGVIFRIGQNSESVSAKAQIRTKKDIFWEF